jgi:hypothetical protein
MLKKKKLEPIEDMHRNLFSIHSLKNGTNIFCVMLEDYMPLETQSPWFLQETPYEFVKEM